MANRISFKKLQCITKQLGFAAAAAAASRLN